MKPNIVIAMGLCLLCSCQGDGDDAKAVNVQLSGAVEKGPFVLGTSIAVSPIDASGNPTGEVFNTSTVNDLGQFNIEFDAVDYVSLEGSGFYYNEVSGALSDANLTLRAFHDVAAGGAQEAYLNIVTHLAYERVVNLVGGELTFPEAIAQAEQEVRDGIGVGPQGYDPGATGTELNILGGDIDPNAYLFAISSVLAKAGKIQAGGPDGPVDAALQELLNGFGLDLRDDGVVGETTVNLLLQAQTELDPGAVMSSLAERLDALGSSAEVPDLNRFIDTDLDGLANANDNCPIVANADQADGDADLIGDACDCGSGTLDQGEECDDGNDVETDTCTTACLDAACGDQIVQEGVEECDDGNDSNTDACTNECNDAACGDGFIQEGEEECDDGNVLSTDACTEECVPNVCGDGYVDGNAERCDDGNDVEGDLCNGDCQSFGLWDATVLLGDMGTDPVAIDVSSDDGIVLRSHYLIEGGNHPTVSRYLVNGSVDWAWQGDALGISSSTGCVAALDDGGALLTYSAAGSTIIRLTSDGQLGWTLPLDGMEGACVATSATGEIFVAGTGFSGDLELKQIATDGSAAVWTEEISSFSMAAYYTRIAIAGNGDLLVATTELDYVGGVEVGRYSSVGAEIWTSEDDLSGGNCYFGDIAIGTGDRPFVGGRAEEGWIARSYTSSGDMDVTWTGDDGNAIRDVAWLPDGRAIGTGDAGGTMSVSFFPTTGDADPTTHHPGGWEANAGYAIAALSDGSFAVAWSEIDQDLGENVAMIALVSGI